MMLTLKWLVILFTQVLFLSITFNTAYSQEEKLITVELSISADEQLKNEIVSYISRELRSLGDVSISDIYKDYEISIIAKEMFLKNGNSPGYIMSFTIAKPLDINKISSFIKDDKNKDLAKVELLLNHYVSILYESLIGLPKEELASKCQSFIAQFDTKILATHRKTPNWDELHKRYNERSEMMDEILQNIKVVKPKK